MLVRHMRTFLVLCSLGLLVASCSSIEGRRLIESARTPDALFFVEHQPRDGRHLEVKIAESLQAHGLKITPERDQADYVVTYKDRWMWDMRMYLRELSIDVVDARTDALVGSGRSRQDSLAALGKTHRDVIDRAVAAIFEGK